MVKQIPLKQISHWSLQFPPVDSYYSTTAPFLLVICGLYSRPLWGCIMKVLSHTPCLCENNWYLLKFGHLNHTLGCKYVSKQLMWCFFITSVHNQEQMLVNIRNTNYFACSKFADLLHLIFAIPRVSLHLIYTVFIFYCLFFMYHSINPARSNNLWDIELATN